MCHVAWTSAAIEGRAVCSGLWEGEAVFPVASLFSLDAELSGKGEMTHDISAKSNFPTVFTIEVK